VEERRRRWRREVGVEKKNKKKNDRPTLAAAGFLFDPRASKFLVFCAGVNRALFCFFPLVLHARLEPATCSTLAAGVGHQESSARCRESSGIDGRRRKEKKSERESLRGFFSLLVTFFSQRTSKLRRVAHPFGGESV